MTALQKRMEVLFDRLWPIHRSILGSGYRQSLDILSEMVPFERLRFATGTEVLDWTIPREWIVREAYVIDPQGRRRWDVKENNLHLVGYSAPFRGTVSREQLEEHLHSIPEQPEAIPYITSYYQERWGFCLTHAERMQLSEGEYQVVVDTELVPGFLEVGEAVLPGESDEEILITSYLCHPSMANNELSGPLTLAFLYEKLAALEKRRYTYRFMVCPETIGSIAYLSERGEHLRRTLHAGYVLTVIGDRGPFTYKRSWLGSSAADQAAELVLAEYGNHTVMDYFPNGSDERQFNSPGYRLPFGSLMRTVYAHSLEYHTSLDNKDYISFESLEESVNLCYDVAMAHEVNRSWVGTVQNGEPFLSKYGVYPTQHSLKKIEDWKMALLWLLNQSDGTQDLFAISQRSGLSITLLHDNALILEKVGLLNRQDEQSATVSLAPMGGGK
ncbi:MAG: DUF4910 domain-containing protein [bacterium]